jgi:hypothetical protein
LDEFIINRIAVKNNSLDFEKQPSLEEGGGKKRRRGRGDETQAS